MAAVREHESGLSSALLVGLSEVPGLRLYGIADPAQLQQVFLNLFNNAIDAIGQGGGTVEITSRDEGNKVVIDVADTGHGIPPSVMARIFDPFFTTKPVGKGTGLGLAVSQGIVQHHGGHIRVQSEVGKGSRFFVWLPAEKRSEKE